MILEAVYYPSSKRRTEYLLIDCIKSHLDDILFSDRVDQVLDDGTVVPYKNRKGLAGTLPRYWCWHPKTWIEA